MSPHDIPDWKDVLSRDRAKSTLEEYVKQAYRNDWTVIKDTRVWTTILFLGGPRPGTRIELHIAGDHPTTRDENDKGQYVRSNITPDHIIYTWVAHVEPESELFAAMTE